MKSPKSPELYYTYLFTLAQFGDPKLLERTLELAISPDVRSQDALQLVSAVMGNPAGEKVTWDFIRQHWAQLARLAVRLPARRLSELPACSAMLGCAIR